MAIKISFLVAASVAAYTVKQISNSSSKSSNFSIKQSDIGDEENFKPNQSEMNEKIQFTDSNSIMEKAEKDCVEMNNVTSASFVDESLDKLYGKTEFPFSMNKFDLQSNVNEVECLQNVVKELEERIAQLETELFLYYGLKEQEVIINELKRLLKVKGTEIEMLKMTINWFLVERKEAEEEIERSVLEKKQLERAKNKINELETRINVNRTKGQVMMLKEQVSRFGEDGGSNNDAKVGENVKKVELEAMELKRRNKELQLEKRVLAIKLLVTEARITAFSNTTESKMVSRIMIEANNLRHANEELLKHLENLQKNRFSMVEELVYQHWINACLRHEIQDYQTPSRKTSASDLSNTSDRITNRGEINIASCSPSQLSYSKTNRISRRTSLIEKLKSWRRSPRAPLAVSSPKSSLESFPIRSSIRRRSSMSSAPAEASTASVPCRMRRVSFSDSIQTSATSFSDKDPINMASEDSEKIIEEKADESLNLDSGETVERKHPLTSPGELTELEKNSTDSKVELKQLEGSSLMESRTPDSGNSDEAQPQALHISALSVFFILLIFIFFVLRCVGVL